MLNNELKEGVKLITKNYVMTEHYTSTQEIWKSDDDGIHRKYSISEYEALPNGQLHGIHTLTTYSKDINSKTTNVVIETKLFDKGSLIKKLGVERILFENSW